MRRISPSMLVAVVALVLSCTGGAVAAGYITSAQVKDNSLTGRDIRNRSLTPADFSGSVRGDDGRDGAPGPTGPQGPAGPAGPQGPAGPSAVSALTTSEAADHPAGAVDGGTVACPAGQRVVSGGFFSDSGVVFLSRPTGDRTGWMVAVDNSGSSVSGDLEGYALCAGSGQAVAARAITPVLRAPSGELARRIAARRAR